MTQLKLATARRRDVEEFYADGGSLSDAEIRVLNRLNPEAWSMAISEQGYRDAGKPTPLQTRREAEKKKSAVVATPAPNHVDLLANKTAAQFEKIHGKILDIKASLATLLAQDGGEITALKKRIEELEKQIVALLPNAAMLSVTNAVQDLQRTMAAPVVAVYDKGKVIGSKRAIPPKEDSSLIAKLQQRIADLEDRPIMKYAGVWNVDTQYAPGQFVTHAGGMWHVKRTTRGRPGQCDDFTLCVKPGRDGKDLR